MSSSSEAAHSLPVLSLRAAEVASAAAQKKAKELGIDVNIAIVDSTLQLLHFIRMPTAKLTSVNTAIDKAYTAAGHRLPTSTYMAKNFLPGGPAYGLNTTNGGRFSIIGGGVPVEIAGRVVGALGVSTGTPAQDIEVAEAGVRAVGDMVRRSQGPKL